MSGGEKVKDSRDKQLQEKLSVGSLAIKDINETNQQDKMINAASLEISHHDNPSNLSSEDEDEDDESDLTSPSILKIMANNHESISQTVSLIHKEAAKFNVGIEKQSLVAGSCLNPISNNDPDNDVDICNSDNEQDGDDEEDRNKSESAIEGERLSSCSSSITSSSSSSLSQPPRNKTTTATTPTSSINTNTLLVQYEEIEGLSNFLADTSVQKLIKSVAGGETTSFIDKTLTAVNSSQSMQKKRAVLSGGIKQLHSDLLVNKEKITKDPLFSLALGMAGLNKRSINFD